MLAVVVLGMTSLGEAQRPSGDVTQWRGAARDGIITGLTAPQAWPETLTERWKVEIGTGYATPLVVGDRVYQFSRIGDNETMTALDAASGKVVWQAGYPATFTMNPATKQHGPGPKSTPVFFNGRLYSIGMTGTVTAWDAASGKQVWQKAGTGPEMLYTTHAFSPLVDAGHVIFHVGGNDKGALTAFDLNTGRRALELGRRRPRLRLADRRDLDGVRQIITPTQVKIVGVDADHRRAALGAADGPSVRVQLDHAHRERPDGHRRGHRAAVCVRRRPACRSVDDGADLGER